MTKKQQAVRDQDKARLDQLAAATEREFKDKHTLRVESARRVAQFQLAELDNELTGLASAVAAAKLRRAELVSRVVGLDRVLAGR